MGSSKKGMLNVLIAAVLWGSSGVCAQFIMQESQMSSPFLTMTRLLFAGLILLMLGFVHGDRIFPRAAKPPRRPQPAVFLAVWRANRAVHLSDDH